MYLLVRLNTIYEFLGKFDYIHYVTFFPACWFSVIIIDSRPTVPIFIHILMNKLKFAFS